MTTPRPVPSPGPSSRRTAKTRSFRIRGGAKLAVTVMAVLAVIGPWGETPGLARHRSGDTRATRIVGPYESGGRTHAAALPAVATQAVASYERYVIYSRNNPQVGIESTGSSFSTYLQLDQASARSAAGYFYDGGAWASSSTVATTSDWMGTDEVVPAGRALVLPKGIYAVSAYLDHEGNMGNGNIALSWYSLSPVVGDELGQPPFYMPGFPGGAVATEHDGFVANGILAHFSDTPVPFVFSFSAYPPTPGVTIQNYTISVQKISNVA